MFKKTKISIKKATATEATLLTEIYKLESENVQLHAMVDQLVQQMKRKDEMLWKVAAEAAAPQDSLLEEVEGVMGVDTAASGRVTSIAEEDPEPALEDGSKISEQDLNVFLMEALEISRAGDDFLKKQRQSQRSSGRSGISEQSQNTKDTWALSLSADNLVLWTQGSTGFTAMKGVCEIDNIPANIIVEAFKDPSFWAKWSPRWETIDVMEETEENELMHMVLSTPTGVKTRDFVCWKRSRSSPTTGMHLIAFQNGPEGRVPLHKNHIRGQTIGINGYLIQALPAKPGKQSGARVTTIGCFDFHGSMPQQVMKAQIRKFPQWCEALATACVELYQSKARSSVASALAVDTTGDGMADSVVVDATGDGTFDIVLPLTSTPIQMLDTTGDGHVDQLMVDTTGDNQLDTAKDFKPAVNSYQLLVDPPKNPPHKNSLGKDKGILLSKSGKKTQRDWFMRVSESLNI